MFATHRSALPSPRPSKAGGGQSPAPEDTFARCSDLWFQDGNITILAGNYGFCVHRGQLQRHSEVFADMFALPVPAPRTAAAAPNDCVRLYDAPSDVYHFLKALYDGIPITEQHFPAQNFDALAGILRLSSKYFATAQRAQCLALLQRDYPSTLEDWDRREHLVTDTAGRYLPRNQIASPLLLINLARELELFELLPAAFYDLSRYGPSKTAAGTAAPPALVFNVCAPPPTAAAASAAPIHVPDSTARVHLPVSDLVSLLVGREASQTWFARFLRTHIDARAPSIACAHRSDGSRFCRDSFFFLLLNARRAVGGIAIGRDADALYTLRQMREMLHRTDLSDGARTYGLPLCGPCKGELLFAINRAREEAWRMIPQWFGLAPRAAGAEKAERASAAPVPLGVEAAAPAMVFGLVGVTA